MIHTSIEILYGYMLIFWMLQNFYMSIFFQLYERLYTLSMLMLMYGLNTLFVLLAYGLGREMLFAHVMQAVLCMTVLFVCSVECIFWYTNGCTKEIKGIACAQLLAAHTLLAVYLIANYFGR